MATSLTPDDCLTAGQTVALATKAAPGPIKTCKGCQSVSDDSDGRGYGRFTPDS